MLKKVEVPLLLVWSTYKEKHEKQVNIEEENGNVSQDKENTILTGEIGYSTISLIPISLKKHN